MPAAPNPSVIEKTNVDIDLAGGMDESDRVETMDWTKKLYKAENVVIDQSGALVTRPGLTFFGANNATQNCRLLPFEDGVGYLTTAANGNLTINQYNETAKTINNGGSFPELCINKAHQMGAWGTQIDVDGSVGKLESIGMTDKYFILVHQAWTSTSATTGHQIIVRDRESGSIVRTYSRDIPIRLLMVVVNNRYLHFYEYPGNGVTSKFWQLDGNNLPADLSAISTVALASGTESVVDAIAISTTESCVLTSVNFDSQAGLEKFNTSGASTGSTTVNNITPTGMANTMSGALLNTNTKFWICGIGNTGKYAIKRITQSTLAVDSTLTDSTATTTLTTCRIATDNSTVYLVAYGAFATTSTVNVPYVQVWKESDSGGATTLTHVGNFNGYVEQGLPIYSNVSGSFYLPLMKFNTGNSGTTGLPDTVAGATVVVDIGARTSISTNIPYAFRIAGILDEYTDDVRVSNISTGIFGKDHFGCPYRPIDINPGYYLYFAHQYKTTNSSYAFEILETIKGAAQFMSCDTDIISGGMLSTWDGLRASETGFVETPSVFATISGSGTALTALGIYNWFAIYEYKDLKGKSHYSRCSIVSSATVGAAAKNGTIQVTIPVITGHDRVGTASSCIRILLYRTISGGTQYFLTKNVPVISAAQDTVISITDDTTDVTLASQPVPFRQPGTQGTALDRYHGLAANHVVRHKDRVFYCKGNKVYFSSFAVDGEAPWFHPAFSIFVPGGSGQIIGLATLDGNLIVFKRNAIFIVEGDGPPENGGNGFEFSPPRKLNTEFGCVDARSIVAVPSGIMYNSPGGIYLLMRNGSVDFVGQPVMKTTDTYPYCHGAAFDRKNQRAYFAIDDTEQPDGVSTTQTNGRCVIYDFVAKAWTKALYPATRIQDVCFAAARVSGSIPSAGAANSAIENLIFIDRERGIYQSDDLTGKDVDNNSAETFVPIIIETGYIHAPSKQDRIRISDLFLAGSWKSAHGITVTNAVDYTESFSTVKAFSEATLTAITGPLQLDCQPPRELVQSMRFRITTTAPATIGTGRQLDLFGLTVRLGLKGGGAKIAVAQKG